jgi:uncharacterized membrane protein YphA (DoxX/SURF4 family)
VITVELPFLVGAVVLVLAGVGKLRHPAGTSQALRTQGLPAAPGLVRGLGAVEVVVALAALAGRTEAVWALAVLYVGFTAFVLVALFRHRPMSSCGCFGEADVPATHVHAVLTSVVAVAAAWAATGPVGIPALLDRSPADAVAVVLVTALLTGLTLLALTSLPRLTAARTRIQDRRPA